MRGELMLAVALVGSPAIAAAQSTYQTYAIGGDVTRQTTDDITWPADGKFPAYPPEPDERRVVFSVSGGLYHDNNLFRLSDSVSPLSVLGTDHKSDTIYRVAAGLKADIPVSRQRLLFDAQVDDYKYDRFSRLDHVGYRAGGAWKWQVASALSGDIGYSRQRYMANLAELQSQTKDMITVDHAFANAGLLVTPRWRVRGGLDWYKYDHGDLARESIDSRTSSATVGLDYVTPANNSVGAQVKYTDGNYPNREVIATSTVDNQYKETEASAVMHWMVTGKSTFDGRLGYTRRTHEQVPQRDFSGATGRLSLDWSPAAKTILNFAAWREIRSVEDFAASYVLTKGVGFGPSWAPTSKLVFQAKLVYEKRDYEGDPGFVLASTPQREDTIRGARLSAGYAPRRNIDLAVTAERGTRSSNTAFRDYDYTAVFANAKLRF